MFQSIEPRIAVSVRRMAYPSRKTTTTASTSWIQTSHTVVPCYTFKVLRRALGCLALCAILTANAYGTSPCYQWRANSTGMATWWDDAKVALSDFALWCSTGTGQRLCDNVYCSAANLAAGAHCSFTANWQGYTTFPAVNGVNALTEVWTCPTCSPSSGSTLRPASVVSQVNPAACKVYVSARASERALCGPARSCVGHPINPASGAVYDTIVDVPPASGSPAFQHFYNSTDPGSPDLSAGWRHSFSRTIQPKYAGTNYQLYVQDQDHSSLYTDEATACISGFAEIKARSSTWANAGASYANGICSLTTGSTRIGTLTLLYTSTPTPTPSTLTLVGYDATRDDGQLVIFFMQGGLIVASSTIGSAAGSAATAVIASSVNSIWVMASSSCSLERPNFQRRSRASWIFSRSISSCWASTVRSRSASICLRRRFSAVIRVLATGGLYARRHDVHVLF